jgi:hypothetical protein
MVHSTVADMHIKAVRESLAGYDLSVNAYKKAPIMSIPISNIETEAERK